MKLLYQCYENHINPLDLILHTLTKKVNGVKFKPLNAIPSFDLYKRRAYMLQPIWIIA